MKNRDVVLGAMYSAFSVLLLALSVTFGNDVFLLMLSSIPIAFAMDHLGYRAGILSYFTVLALSFAFFAVKPSIVGFAVVFGPYTLIRVLLSRKSFLLIVVRWITLIGLSLIAYEISEALLGIHGNYFKLAALILVVITLLLYERFVELSLQWHRKFIKKFSNMER